MLTNLQIQTIQSCGRWLCSSGITQIYLYWALAHRQWSDQMHWSHACIIFHNYCQTYNVISYVFLVYEEDAAMHYCMTAIACLHCKHCACLPCSIVVLTVQALCVLTLQHCACLPCKHCACLPCKHCACLPCKHCACLPCAHCMYVCSHMQQTLVCCQALCIRNYGFAVGWFARKC